MKKITLKYYGHLDPAKVLTNAFDFLRSKIEVSNLVVHPHTKTLTFYADPFDAEALRSVLKKKYSVTLITNLPVDHCFFIAFLVKENFYEEAKKFARIGFENSLQGRCTEVDADPNCCGSGFYLNTLFAFINRAECERGERYRKAIQQFKNPNLIQQ